MITSAADYRFVDFANGDLPTDRFDGWIMPRRSDQQSPYPVEMLKAEDIAFLVECVRDKSGAFKGLTFTSYDEYQSEGYVPIWTNPGSVSLTKSISSSQMRGIRNYTTNQLGRGFPHNGLGFLSTPLSEIYSFQLAPGFDFIGRAHAAIAPQFEGIWPATSQAADFAAGQPVLAAPVEAIFDDAKNLVRPVGTTQFGEAFVSRSHLYFATLEGSPPSGMRPYFGYRMTHYNTTTPWAVRGYFNTCEVVKISRDFLSSANIWLLYVAENRTDSLPDDSTPSSDEFRAGLIRLSDYLTPARTATEFHWAITPTDGLRLYNRILSDCGWTEASTSDATMQEIYPLYSCSIIVEGTPNGRTQWW